jgi:hypothetical protein
MGTEAFIYKSCGGYGGGYRGIKKAVILRSKYASKSLNCSVPCCILLLSNHIFPSVQTVITEIYDLLLSKSLSYTGL